MNQVSTQYTTQQLITESLNRLSSDLHSQMSQTLNQLQEQQPQTIDKMVQQHLESMLPSLYQQLLTHLTEQVGVGTEFGPYRAVSTFV